MPLHRTFASGWKDYPTESEPNEVSVSLQGSNALALAARDRMEKRNKEGYDRHEKNSGHRRCDWSDIDFRRIGDGREPSGLRDR
ncbi:MAG: hypothetical protein LBQ54_14350 [Planctomycetaceae bacterium]|nr:hypothetical protein [Planctomycetaceae bacterium]